MSAESPASSLPAGLSANSFSNLFQAVGGVRNTRAIVVLLGCTFVGLIVAGLLATLSGTVGALAGLLGGLFYLVAVATGVNAAGLLQMDDAEGRPARSIGDALGAGLACIPKLIVLALAFVAVEVAVFIVIALLLLICKIPFLGAVLFVAVFPLSVLAAGITIVGIFICMAFSLPAIWQGATITHALSQTFAIARARIVEAILLLVFVGFLAFAVGLVVFGILGAGLFPVLGMSASIVGAGGMGDMGSVMGMIQGGGGGRAIAGMIGGLLLWAVAGSVVAQVQLRGIALVYLRVTEGLDVGSAESELRARLDEAKRRAADLGSEARAAAERGKASFGATPAAPAAGAAAAATAAAAAAYSPAPPAHDVPPVYNPPPAYSPPPEPPSFEAMRSAAFGATLPQAPTPMPPPVAKPAAPSSSSESADILLPFDDDETTRIGAPGPAPSWQPPKAAPPPPVAPPAAPKEATCPQCLSPVTPDDAFCGVCGYRLK